MKPKRMSGREGRGSLRVALGTAILLALLSLTSVLEPLELPAQDLLLRSRPPHSTSAHLVIVAVDNETEAAWQEPMPFWGYRLALLLAALKHAQVRQVGLDFVVASPADDTIYNALERWAVRTKKAFPLDDLPPELQPHHAFVPAVEDWEGRLVLADTPDQQTEALQQLRENIEATRGRIVPANLPSDSDGIVRRAYLSEKINRRTLPGFAARIAQNAGVSLPQSRDSTFGINFAGKVTATAFPLISAQRVLQGNLTLMEKESLKGSIVLVGSTYAGTRDKHLTPGDVECFGVVLQAHALATLLDGRPLRRASPIIGAVCALIAGLLMTGAARTFALLRAFVMLAILASGYGFAARGLLISHDLLMPIVPLLLGLIVPPTVQYAARAFEEKRQRLQVERLFGRQVSPAIRDYLLTHSALRTGEQQSAEAAILFVDIRNFSGFAEMHTPPETFAALNALFAELVPIIEQNGGLVYRFLGDGFLAVFGVPLPLQNASQAAVNAALALIERPRLLPESSFGGSRRIGCGIHTGEVICGNLGAKERAEFTVIGDTINLAARLEGMNKERCSDICISAETAQRLNRLDGWAGPDLLPVRGRTQPITVYTYRASGN